MEFERVFMVTTGGFRGWVGGWGVGEGDLEFSEETEGWMLELPFSLSTSSKLEKPPSSKVVRLFSSESKAFLEGDFELFPNHPFFLEVFVCCC